MSRRDKDIIGYLYNDSEQKIREQIAQEIEAILLTERLLAGDDHSDLHPFIKAVYKQCIAIARGENV